MIPTQARSERDARSAGESFFTLRSTFAICQATELSNIWRCLSNASNITTAPFEPAPILSWYQAMAGALVCEFNT